MEKEVSENSVENVKEKKTSQYLFKQGQKPSPILLCYLASLCAPKLKQ